MRSELRGQESSDSQSSAVLHTCPLSESQHVRGPKYSLCSDLINEVGEVGTYPPSSQHLRTRYSDHLRRAQTTDVHTTISPGDHSKIIAEPTDDIRYPANVLLEGYINTGPSGSSTADSPAHHTGQLKAAAHEAGQRTSRVALGHKQKIRQGQHNRQTEPWTTVVCQGQRSGFCIHVMSESTEKRSTLVGV